MAYRTVETRVWDDEWFRNLSDKGKLLWLHLLTGPATTSIPGLFRAGEAQLAEELGWSLEAFREAFREAFPEGPGDPRVKVDWKAKLVWIRRAVRESNLPQSPNVVKGWARIAREHLPECPLLTEALIGIRNRVLELRQDSEAFAKAFQEAFPKAFAKALAESRTINQNQNHKEPPPPTSSSAPDGGGGQVLDRLKQEARALVPAQEAWTRFEAIRADHITGQTPDGLAVTRGLKPEKPPRGFDEWWGRVNQEPGIFVAYDRYLNDDHFRGRAWPFRLFMQPGVYEARLT